MSQTKPRSPSTPHRQSQGGKDFRKRVQRSKEQGEAPVKQTASKPRAGNPAAKPCIILKAGREKSLLRRHPWIFSGAVECIDGAPASGDTVPVRDSAGNFLAWAAYNPDSQITARVWSWNEKDVIDKAFFRQRISDALAARRTLGLERDSSGMRIVHGESDGLPGLIVDKYDDVLVMQLGSAGPERWRETIADILQELCTPACIYERSDSDGRELEGLPKRCAIVRGTLPEMVEVIENGFRFAVDVAEGQKTGYYLDQRDNRALTGTLATGRDVLNCFCYTGGFSLYALRGGAKSVLSIDSSQEALELAQRNVELNGLDASRAEWQCADVFEALRKLRDQNRKFDLIVLDPPKFAPTAAFAEKASRAYKDINLLGFKLLRPGGLLFTYSCSGGISDDLFQKIIAGAALDAGVDVQIVKKLHAAADHPVLLSFPEGAYLKGLVLRVAG
ncbi:MAG: class I SAM-dependent rRNA methyltransferase [Nitrosomonadales bacterium]|nr:class I SAM-dependent rRNA methyltransferase [Nitrosomonadales bacterium]